MKSLLIVSFILAALVLFGSRVPTLAAHHDVCVMHCQSCALSCDQAAKKLEKKNGSAALIKQLRDCAKTCRAYNHGRVDKAKNMACVSTCRACAAACEQAHDLALKDCIKECLACADCCAQ